MFLKLAVEVQFFLFLYGAALFGRLLKRLLLSFLLFFFGGKNNFRRKGKPGYKSSFSASRLLGMLCSYGSAMGVGGALVGPGGGGGVGLVK